MIQEITHNKNTVIFNPQNHSYYIKGTDQRLTGVTTFIKKFFPKFDADEVAIEVGKKRGVSPESLKAEWKQKALDGDNVHEYSEYVFGNGEKVDPINHRAYLLMVQLFKASLKLKNQGYVSLQSEKIIFSATLGLSGIIDLLMSRCVLARPTIAIIDFKTSETLSTYNPFQNAFSPINHLEDANLVHYSLQLNLYQYILETEKYFPADVEFKKIIVHLMVDDYRAYVCRDMFGEIESMLI